MHVYKIKKRKMAGKVKFAHVQKRLSKIENNIVENASIEKQDSLTKLNFVQRNV